MNKTNIILKIATLCALFISILISGKLYSQTVIPAWPTQVRITALDVNLDEYVITKNVNTSPEFNVSTAGLFSVKPGTAFKIELLGYNENMRLVQWYVTPIAGYDLEYQGRTSSTLSERFDTDANGYSISYFAKVKTKWLMVGQIPEERTYRVTFRVASSWTKNAEIEEEDTVEVEISQFEVSLYPNPVSDLLNISLSNFDENNISDVNIQIYNEQTGKLVKTYTTSENDSKVDVSSLEIGRYVIRIIKGDCVLSKHIVVKR